MIYLLGCGDWAPFMLTSSACHLEAAGTGLCPQQTAPRSDGNHFSQDTQPLGVGRDMSCCPAPLSQRSVGQPRIVLSSRFCPECSYRVFSVARGTTGAKRVSTICVSIGRNQVIEIVVHNGNRRLRHRSREVRHSTRHHFGCNRGGDRDTVEPGGTSKLLNRWH